MAIDHIAVLMKDSLGENTLYLTMRLVGRLAFPLFCFLLVESFYFTKDKKKHLLKIGVLAVVSEIPFNAFVSGRIFDLSHQNVCVTLGLGFLMLCVLNADIDRLMFKWFKGKRIRKVIVSCVRLNIVGIFGIAAFLLRSDYMWQGILLISLFNIAKHRKHIRLWQMWAVIIFACAQSNVIYSVCLLDIIPVYLTGNYKSAKKQKHSRRSYTEAVEKETLLYKVVTGKVSKRICSVFYPAHGIYSRKDSKLRKPCQTGIPKADSRQ